jgi:hypothetical protein
LRTARDNMRTRQIVAGGKPTTIFEWIRISWKMTPLLAGAGSSPRLAALASSVLQDAFTASLAEITEAKFVALGAAACRDLWNEADEQCWWSNPSGSIVGVMLYAPSEGWRFSICVRDDSGEYRRIAIGADLPNQQLARLQLVAHMRALDPG